MPNLQGMELPAEEGTYRLLERAELSRGVLRTVVASAFELGSAGSGTQRDL
jgi:hypothetical protein